VYVAVGLCAILLIRAVYVTGTYFAVRSPGEATAALVPVVSGAQEERIRTALEASRLLHGKYPAGLDALVQDGLLRREDLVYPHGLPYRYTPPSNGGSYRLESP
jgi:hypothetical protein